jgi:hypothetical protein
MGSLRTDAKEQFESINIVGDYINIDASGGVAMLFRILKEKKKRA